MTSPLPRNWVPDVPTGAEGLGYVDVTKATRIKKARRYSRSQVRIGDMWVELNISFENLILLIAELHELKEITAGEE